MFCIDPILSYAVSLAQNHPITHLDPLTMLRFSKGNSPRRPTTKNSTPAVGSGSQPTKQGSPSSKKLGDCSSKVSNPNRAELASDLDRYEVGNYSTDFKQSMKTVIIQSFSHRLAESHVDDGVNSKSTPRTKDFMLSAAHLESVGPESIVLNRDKLLREAADVYLGRQLFSPQPPNALLINEKHDNGIGVSPKTLFGGDVPSNADKHNRTSHWDGIQVQDWSNFACAVIQPGYGPNSKVVKTMSTLNGFRSREYGCKHNVECRFRGRVFYPVPDDGEYVRNSKGIYEKIDRHNGPVASQTIHKHSCGQLISWTIHLQNAKSKGGLHPVLKEAVDREGGADAYNLLAPDMMYQRMLDLYSDDVDTLFPHGCQSLVMNQIRLYWTRERKRILDKRNGQTVEVKFLSDIKIFRDKHALKLSGNFKPTSNLDTILQARVLAEQICNEGTKTIRHNLKAAPNGELAYTPEHEMFCLPLPSEDDPDYGHIMKMAREKDNLSSGDAEDHLVPFTSINLLRQVTIASKKYGNKLMMCIDSTHGSDSIGGKLMSFGYISFDKPGNQGSKYRHTYVPSVFSRIKNEDEQSALFMFSSTGSAVLKLFGIKLDVKGGLISDHAQSFVNAYKTFFPNRPIGQCFPHVLMKFKDQSGRRKRGSPGYLKYIKDRKYFKIACRDVRQMHKCTTTKMKDTYTKMCLEAWRHDGEGDMADVFYKSYVQSLDHSRFRYNEFGNPGDSPQCNSLERFHLSAKGSRQFDGYCKFNRTVDEMLNHQFPRLVFCASSRVSELTKKYRIRDKTSLDLDRELMDLLCALDITKDTWPLKNGAFFVNNRDFEGTLIDRSRLTKYVQATQGEFPVTDFRKRQEHFDAGSSLCYVSKMQVLDGEKEWTCSCVRYWKTTACQHSYLIKYGQNQKLYDNKRRKKNKKQIKDEPRTIDQRYEWKRSGFV
jgi:hypothetical protein